MVLRKKSLVYITESYPSEYDLRLNASTKMHSVGDANAARDSKYNTKQDTLSLCESFIMPLVCLSIPIESVWRTVVRGECIITLYSSRSENIFRPTRAQTNPYTNDFLKLKVKTAFCSLLYYANWRYYNR